MLTSQISVYLGKAGFNSRIPFMQRATKESSPNFTPSSKKSIEESAERAVFIGLYPNPDL